MVRILLVLILSVRFSLPVEAGGRDRTGLMWGALAGRGEVARILPRGGGDANLVDGEGKSAADYAIDENHRWLAEELGRVS